MDEQILDCLIVGGGPAGLTAAIYLARFHLDILVVDGGKSRAASIPCTRNHAGYADLLRGTPLSDLYPAVPSRVEGYLTGCCLLVSRAAWDDLGGFDDRFFVYGEEADWQRRAACPVQA